MKKLTSWMIGFAIVGIVLSTYAFLHNRGFAPGSICTINATINCDVVNKGPFSLFFGIPVALIGLFGYCFMLIGTILKRKAPEDRSLTLFLLALAYGGFGFSLYLTSIEATILHAWCLICVASQISILSFDIAATWVAQKEDHFSFFQKLFHKS